MLRRHAITALTILALAPGLAGCGKSTPTGATGTNAYDAVDLVKRGPGGTTRFLARNVLYRLDKNITMNLVEMNADVRLKDPSLPFVPANKSEYDIIVHRASVMKGPNDLEALMNTYVFNDADAPIRNVKMALKGDKLVMTGEMKQVIWVKFEMEGVMSPTPEGKIRMTPVSVKSVGMRVDGLMKLVGLEMSKLVKMKAEKGLEMDGNDIIMDPARLYPPPTLIGHVTDVTIKNGAMYIEMNDGQAKPWPEMPVANVRSTLAMWGGDVLINATLCLNAKMQILDGTPATPMVFALDRYREQLEAGVVTPTRAGHMIAYVPDVLDYDGDMGRYAPPAWPMPGVKEGPSDLGPVAMPVAQPNPQTSISSVRK